MSKPNPVDRLGKELKVGQTVVYPDAATATLAIETVKSIGPKQVTLYENKRGGFTRRHHDQVVIIKEVDGEARPR